MDDSKKELIGLIQKKYEIQNQNFQKAWDFYLKFYMAWLTVNMAGLGLVQKFLVDKSSPDAHWPIAIAFIIMNLMTIGTSIFMGKYTTTCAVELRQMLEVMLEVIGSGLTSEFDVSKPPFPVKSAIWAAAGNAAGLFALIGCWIFISLK